VGLPDALVALRGSDAILQHCEKRLGVHAGHTTKDGRITLRTAECLAAVRTGTDDSGRQRLHENLTIEAVDKILDSLAS